MEMVWGGLLVPEVTLEVILQQSLASGFLVAEVLWVTEPSARVLQC